MSKKILLISGSDREGSFNTQLVDTVLEKLKEKGLEAEELDYSKVPLLSQNTEFPTPEEIKIVRDKVRNSDALFIISPEYNGSYPARLKNLIDWLSRPETAGDNTTPTVLNGKLVGFGSVANSTYGKFVRESLKTLIGYVRATPLEGEGLGIRIPAEAWGTGNLTSGLEDEQIQEINNYVDKFVAAL